MVRGCHERRCVAQCRPFRPCCCELHRYPCRAELGFSRACSLGGETRTRRLWSRAARDEFDVEYQSPHLQNTVRALTQFAHFAGTMFPVSLSHPEHTSTRSVIHRSRYFMIFIPKSGLRPEKRQCGFPEDAVSRKRRLISENLTESLKKSTHSPTSPLFTTKHVA